MVASFFPERPSEFLRLKIERALFQIRDGIHKSRVKGEGPEFRGFKLWDPSDNTARIDYAASYKVSPELDEVVVRTSYGEKRISVVVILDLRVTMGFPLQKLEHTVALFWLFALSAFKKQDRFRTIAVFDDSLVDSGWIFGESALEGFLEQEVAGYAPGAESLYQGIRPISLLADSHLGDAFLIVISDFCASWDEEIEALDYLDMSGRNIRGVFIALDEWSGLKYNGYSIDIRDPRSKAIYSIGSEDVKIILEASEKQFSSLEENISHYPVSFFKIPLICDPIAEFLRVSMGIEID